MPAVSLPGSVALVTGGQRGIGKAFADELLARGASRVYVTAREPKAADDPRLIALPLEVTDDASVAALAAAVSDVTIVVNNAGAGGSGPLLSGDISEIRNLFDINVLGPLRIAQAFAPQLKANGGGALIDLHSALSWAAGAGAYGATKAAYWSVTNSLRMELAEQGTLVVGVHLGFTDTDLTRNVTAPKIAPSVVAIAALNGVEAGDTEVLVDDVSRHFKAALSGPVAGLELPRG
ncbi:MAG TPA: SDR family oxidoreductase [Galbitalea sp.]|jgi:NAD(P)-dependent dehydrogenase (short-subunit alcohol dehydrogenase family)